MKRHLVLLGMVLLMGSLLLRGEGPEDRYVQIFNLIEQADTLNESGHGPEAAVKYFEAQQALKALQGEHPDWNGNLVNFRLGYVASKLALLAPKTPGTPGTNTPTVLVEAAPGPGAGTNQFKQMQEEIQRLTAQNALLEARIKEALSVQPAALDPRELAKAEEQIRRLQKEKELLKVSLEQEKAKSVPGTDLSVLEQERQIVADVKQKLAQQTELAMALQKENELLKQQLAAAAPVQAPSSTGAASELAKQQLEAAKSTIAALQTSNLALRTEQLLLQSRVADLTKHPGKRAQPAPGPGEQNSQLENALARLAVYESKPVPYTAEELALFKQPDLKASVAVAQAGPAKKAVKELPPGAGPIMEEAKRAAENGRLEEAEKKFQEVLRQDEKNTYTLGHLAAVQIEQNRLGDAEKTINQALGVDPRDPACLFTLGLLKYRQEKYDAALDALSLSASLIPDEPRTQYFLGKTLIEKGNRTAAEAALRKAVQLRPGWSEAHFSLAMVYATQQPPFKELAQWHYQKAIEKGYPRNLEFEKLLEEKRPSTAGQ